jgi:hypothetical protein
MILFFVFFAVTSIHEMNVLGDFTLTLYEHPLRVSNAALRANMDVSKMQSHMKDVVLSASEMELYEAIQQVRTREDQVYQELDKVKKYILGSEGKELEQQTRQAFSDWRNIRENIIQLVMNGDTEAAYEMTRRKGAEHVRLLERKMSELTAYARHKAEGFMTSAEQKQREIVRKTIFFICAVIFLSLLIIYFMSTSIMSNLSVLRETMSRITKTGELVKSEIIGKNEITEMSRHFNGLVDKLHHLFWLRDGQNNLNRELSGELTFDQIVTRSINFVSRYVSACSGALYSYDQEASRCELKSSFAFVERNYLANTFRLGEGIVGQVAVEKSPILLKNISRQEALAHTGTVSEPPKNIYALPLFHEEKLYGVLEVASFEDIDDVKKEFLDKASEAIAVFLYSAFQNEQIKALLKTTKESNEQLQAQAEEMGAMYEEIKKQSEEVQEQNTELEAQRRQVEEANRLKSAFLSNMSHELRTPLNSVMALSRVLITQAGEKLSDEETNYLEIIERNGQHLLHLINEILDLSKIEAGRMEVNPQTFSIRSCLEDIVERLQPLAEEKGLQIIENMEQDLPWIENDALRVEQILENITGNALKFTEQGNVTIAATSDADNVSIEVKDTGIGIAKEDLKHIFDEFRQVDGSSSRRFEGTGLGLTIASKTIKMLGGNIFVDSTLGQGTLFTITLPVKWQGKAVVYESPDEGHPFVSSSSQTSGAQILLVEDNESAVIQVKDSLEREGLVVDVARNGLEALESLEQRLPNGIILDLMMPEVDGFEVLEAIKNDHVTAGIPVLILTAKDLTPAELTRLKSNHIYKLIQKGDVDLEALLVKVKEMVGLAANEQATGAEHKNKGQTSGNCKKSGLSAETKNKNSHHCILVIEDNPDNMVTLKSVLKGRFQILEAVDGETGFQLARSELPDLVLLDMSLPGMDGFQVVEKIKANTQTRDIVVIALTARAMKGDKEFILQAGCDDYISKPIDPEKLAHTIQAWLEKGETNDEDFGD